MDKVGTGRGRGRGRVRGRGNVIGIGDTSNESVVVVRGRGRSRGRGLGRGQTLSVIDSSRATLRNDFERAYSTNLPGMSYSKVAEYFQSLRSPELRQAKDELSASVDYGDNAIGYVRVKKENDKCIVEARVTPQTSVNKEPYITSVGVDDDKSIFSVSCNCQASIGNCKHETALIFWLLRRYEEPAPTDVRCYWKRSILSTVRNVKAKSIDELSKRNTQPTSYNDSLLKLFIEMGKDSNKEAGVIRYFLCTTVKTLYIDHLFISFTECHPEQKSSYVSFLEFCSNEMTSELCEKVFAETASQSAKSEWYYQRFGRVTASKFYECSRCVTQDGSLVAALMGARGFKGNAATRRGQELEKEVFNLLKKKYRDIKQSGIVIRGDMPIFGASPDGISKDYVFEIKCPTKAKTIENYLKDNIVQPKVYYQLQLQMMMSKKTEGILCIADPNFEKNNKIIIKKVDFDHNQVKPLINRCEKFWQEFIFPLLK